MKKILTTLCIFISTLTYAQSQRNQFQIIKDSLIINHNEIHDENGYLVYKKNNIVVEEIEIIKTNAFKDNVFIKKIVCSISDKFVELNEYQEKILYDLLKK